MSPAIFSSDHFDFKDVQIELAVTLRLEGDELC